MNVFGTTRAALALLACSAALPMVGCGDAAPASSPYEGTYKIVRHTRNVEDCGGEGDTQRDDGYFRLAQTDGMLAFYVCSAPDACQGAVNESKSFSQQDGDEWVGRTIDAQQVRGGCEVTLTERTAQIISEENGDVRLETYTYEGEVSREEGAECTDQLILDSRSELTCGEYDVVLGVPIDE